MSGNKKALIVIDVQNDYFPNGKFPLWNQEATFQNVLKAIQKAKDNNIPIVLVQHVVNGEGPFFVKGSEGVEIHKDILAAAPNAPIVLKEYADSFHQTTLEETLSGLGVTELIVTGMMTHNCITHTSMSKAAEKYKVSVISDCVTTVSEIMHLLALHAIAVRVPLTTLDTAEF